MFEWLQYLVMFPPVHFFFFPPIRITFQNLPQTQHFRFSQAIKPLLPPVGALGAHFLLFHHDVEERGAVDVLHYLFVLDVLGGQLGHLAHLAIHVTTVQNKTK